jgi:hypothetical protein
MFLQIVNWEIICPNTTLTIFNIINISRWGIKTGDGDYYHMGRMGRGQSCFTMKTKFVVCVGMVYEFLWFAHVMWKAVPGLMVSG